MAKVVMYATRYCPYCIRVRQIFEHKGVSWQEIAVDGEAELRAELAARCGQTTVPQIWIDERHIGGCSDLMELDYQGKLDGLLGLAGAAN